MLKHTFTLTLMHASSCARRWVHLYTHHLQEKVVSSIGELYEFMNTSNSTLDLKVLGEVRVWLYCTSVLTHVYRAAQIQGHLQW